MALELPQQRPQLHDRLRKERRLLPVMERYAMQLKASHEAWKDRLSRTNPDSHPSQVASQALELALRGLEDRLPPESPPDEEEALSLDAAMAFLLRPMPPA